MKLTTFISAGAFILFSAFIMKKQSLSLYQTKWSLKKIHTAAGTEEVNSKAFIKFDEEKKRAGGNGSCNTFGGSLIVLNDSISIAQIFSTKMYCEGVQKTEDTFFKQLEKVNRFEIKGSVLLLYHDKEALLEFEARH